MLAGIKSSGDPPPKRLSIPSLSSGIIYLILTFSKVVYFVQAAISVMNFVKETVCPSIGESAFKPGERSKNKNMYLNSFKVRKFMYME